jgi:hypothetical protein
MIQLEEMISVDTPQGHGYAIIFESAEFDNFWTVILKSGAIVTFRQKQIRVRADYTRGGISDKQLRKLISKRVR